MFKQIKNHFNAAPVACEIHVDEKQKIIHLLDITSDEEWCTLNIAAEFIQKEILEEIDPHATINDYFWIIYGKDGVASFFENEHFRPVPDILLDEEFKEKMKVKASA